MIIDAGDPGETVPAGERGAIHDSRLDRAAILVATRQFAFAERSIEAGMVLRSEAADKRNGGKCQKK